MPLDNQRKPLSIKEKKLVDNIRYARQDANLTQEELSYRLGKNSNYMGMVESYRRGISFKTLFKITTILNVKATDLFHNL